MNKNIYYIKEFGSEKAKDSFQAQIESIFDRNNFTPILYPRVNYLSRLFFLNRFIRSIPDGVVVFFIHPLYSRTNQLLLKLLLRKKCRPVCIVSDINSLRFHSSVEKETGYWKKLKYFIFQNEKMKEWVEERAGKKISVNIELFDLLFDAPVTERKNSSQVVFAGNTEKCPFINQLHRVENIQWMIYSASPVKNYSNVRPVNLKNELTDRQPLVGSYGLIWEGDSITDISNFGGQYLKWVSPLKLSNYLLNYLPVITHKDAAIAEFVQQNHIGFCVSELHEIGEKIKAITEPVYATMLENCSRFSKKIAAGHYMQHAIDEISKKIEQRN